MRHTAFVASFFFVSLALLGQNSEEPRLFRTSVTLQLYSSKASSESKPESDPAIMIGFSYLISERLEVGIGSGLQSPHFNTNMIPTYILAGYRPLNHDDRLMIQSRLGKFIPLAPDFYKGGFFSEWTMNYDLPTARKTSFRLTAGYSHQRMIMENSDNWWWTDRRITYHFNRVTMGVGVVF